MAYKKPQIVTRSAAKQTFVAGCSMNKPVHATNCSSANSRCHMGPLK